jgi:hypothetical protein
LEELATILNNWPKSTNNIILFVKSIVFLSNLYEFSLQNNKWRLLKTSGSPPSERYGHSMNIYKKFSFVLK